jgi:ArsR family transcriptional regulator
MYFRAMDLKQLEKISKALGDENRLKIMKDIAKRGGSMQCAEIISLLDLAQPSVSHHIKALTEAGLVEREKEGRNNTYLLNKPLLKAYITTLALLLEAK